MDLVRLAAAEAALLSLLGLSTPAQAGGDAEVAAGYYADDNLTSLISSASVGYEGSPLAADDGIATSARVGFTRRELTFKEPGDLLEKQLEGEDGIEEQSVTGSIDQGLGVGTSIGLLAGATESPLTKTRHFGLRAGQWWRQETLQTSIEVRRTRAGQTPIEYTDTDGKRVRTPADLDGVNAALTVTYLTTPTTILRGSVSRTERSDRPNAMAVSGEARQFITAAEAAVHLALTHYENVGAIEPTQSYGSIVAGSVKAEWHQRLPSRLILMGGYRYYIEHEKPRAADAERKQFGSDDMYGSLRWRYGDGAWTDDGSELYAFCARYTTNAQAQGMLVGLGSKLVF